MYLMTPVVCPTQIRRRNSGCMRDSSRMPDSSRKTRLQLYPRLCSYARLRSEGATLVVCMTPIICLTPIICSAKVGRYNFGRIPNSSRTSRLRSHFPTPVNITTLVVSPDSDRASQLWPMSVPCRMSYQLIYERLRMTWVERMSCSAFKTSTSHGITCSSVRPCITWSTST
jgi:hypothetical protein